MQWCNNVNDIVMRIFVTFLHSVLIQIIETKVTVGWLVKRITYHYQRMMTLFNIEWEYGVDVATDFEWSVFFALCCFPELDGFVVGAAYEVRLVQFLDPVDEALVRVVSALVLHSHVLHPQVGSVRG